MAKRYADHELRFLVYSAIFNARVRGENEALARQLHRTANAVSQQKLRIVGVLKGEMEDLRISRLLSEVAETRKREVKKRATHIMAKKHIENIKEDGIVEKEVQSLTVLELIIIGAVLLVVGLIIWVSL